MASSPGGSAGPSDPPRLEVTPAPDDEVLRTVWRLAGEAPLLAPPVLRALCPPDGCLMACRVWRGGLLVAALAGWERGPPYWRRLTFPALPSFAARDEEVAALLWRGLRDLARQRRTPWIELSGLHGPSCAVPRSLGTVRFLRWRLEPVRALQRSPPEVVAGEAHAPPLEFTRDPAAVAAHLALLATGEEATAPGEPLPPPLEPAAQVRLVAAGLASVARLAGPGPARASLLVLDDGARPCLLGVAAAADDTGRKAARALAARLATHLADRGARELLLGGVTESGAASALALRRSLATSERHAMHLVMAPGPRWPVVLEGAWRTGSRHPVRIARRLASRVVALDRFMVHAWGPETWRAPGPDPGVALRRLSDAELISASIHSDALGSHRHYLEQHGINGAWGLFVEGELAHVSWALTGSDLARLPYAHLRPGEGEVELANCVTLPRFRGRGLYPLAIRAISGHLFEGGVRRVYLVTARGNRASVRGIEKAGPRPCGKVSLLWLRPLRRLRIRRVVPGMAAPVEWVDLARTFRAPSR